MLSAVFLGHIGGNACILQYKLLQETHGPGTGSCPPGQGPVPGPELSYEPVRFFSSNPLLIGLLSTSGLQAKEVRRSVKHWGSYRAL